MEQKGTFEIILVEFSLLIQPLADASAEGPDGMRALALRAGLDLGKLLKDSAFDDLNNISDGINALYNTLRPIAEDEGVDSSQIPTLLAEIPHIIDSVSQLDELEIKDGMVEQFQYIGQILFDYLIITYLKEHHTGLYCFLLLIGVIDEGRREDQIYPKISYSNIGNLFKDIGVVAEDVYGWGTPDFNPPLILVRLQGLLWFLGIAANFRQVESSSNLPNVDHDTRLPASLLQLPILSIDREDGIAEFGVSIVSLQPADGSSAGLGLIPFGAAGVSEEIALDDQWRLKIAASAEALVPWGVSLRPESIAISGIENPVAPLTVNLIFSVERQAAAEEKDILFGSPDGMRLELGTIGLKIGFSFDSNRDPEIFVEIPVKELRIVIDSSDSDGFLQNLLPEDGFSASFDLTLGVSSLQGIYFKGSGGLEVSIPTHLSMGPVDLQSLTISAKLAEEGIPIAAGVTVNANLGPLSVAVENMGMTATFSFTENNSGNLGPIDLGMDFKPPNGLGLSIDAGTVTGGGYLYFDFENERYAGALELYIEGLFTLKAIGLITTRMPDGSKGFSLLIIITAEFGTPIQLGYGFTLSGVGGLLGLNRTMRLEPMLDGVRTGAINSVMFPDDLIANAPRIISDLRNFFPPYNGIFLIGPMAKLGWSTPNLITLSLGVIIEIPGNVAIVGILKAILPHEEAAVLKLQVNFLGAIEFDKKRAYLFAALYDSRVLFITLEGEMGVLVAWGDDANFVLSVGGFHPSFDPPPLPFPTPKRIALTILNTSVAKVRIEAYFAITTNTAQFGARAELFFSLSEFKIEGHLSFNALFRFSPFYFEITLSISLSVKVFGIGLFSVRFRGSLEGPTPWHIEGTGSISLLFFDISVDFSKTWGERKETTLPPIEIMPLLKAEFEKLENWQAVVPEANTLLVSLRKIEATEDLVLHPVGTLKISQRAVPLQFKLDKLGTQKPSDANYFDVTLAGADFVVIGEVKESHATAQIKNVSDKQKLSLPPYSKEKGGIELSVEGEQLKTSSAIKRVVRYEQIIIDNNFKRGVNHFVELAATFFRFFVKNSAVSKSSLSSKMKKQQMPFDEKIAVRPNTFVVANNSDNTPLAGEVIEFASYFKAEQFMDEQILSDPGLRDNVHVIPQAEMRKAV